MASVPGLAIATLLISLGWGLAHLDPELVYARRMLASANTSRLDPWSAYLRLVAIQIVVVPLTNAILPGLGEELGWRGFLQPRLMKAGLPVWPAMIVTGAVWGLWHAPVMIRGQYPGHPYLGAAMTIPYCMLLAVIFGWLRIASGSVWVVAVARASLDISSSDSVAALAPGFDFAVAGGLESLVGWIPLLLFISWLVRTKRLPNLRGPLQSSLTMTKS